ncbi:MAG: hypothetical protein JO247_15830 [Chloroflexi bacterium]|nr:hypothetical protein [Chloroflexota bacterium]
MANRYQRRKFGSSLPPRGPRAGARWQLYLLAVLVLVAVIYFRLQH